MFSALEANGTLKADLFIQEIPKAKQSTRFGQGRAYQDKDVVAKESIIRAKFHNWAVQNRFRVIHGAVFVKLVIYLGKGKLNAKKFPTQRPDLENVEKLLNDALNGIAWADDCLIVGKQVAKVWAGDEGPGYRLQIFDMETTL
jgi:Holliday junction resolvase RusA-like endonuclease